MFSRVYNVHTYTSVPFWLKYQKSAKDIYYLPQTRFRDVIDTQQGERKKKKKRKEN